MQKRRCHKLASTETMTKFIHASRTEPLDMSRSTDVFRTCRVPNLSCNHFNQSCSSKGKITRALFCLMRQNRHYLTLSRIFKQHACVLLQNLQFCGVKAELNISMICGGGADAEQNFLEEEQTWSQKNETPSISGRHTLRNFSCMVITSCMSVVVSGFCAELLLGANVLCGILMGCYRCF